MLNVNEAAINKKKLIAYIMIPIVIFFAFAAIGALLDWEIVGTIICGAIALVAAGYSFKIFNMANSYMMYANLINSGFTTIDELKIKVRKSEAEVIEEIEDLIKNNIFLNAFYDRENKRIETFEATFQSNDSGSYLNKYSKFTPNTQASKEAHCPSCGALIERKLYGKTKCEYCGREF